MKKLALFILSIGIFISFIPSSFAHQDGCHRWHSCPSDTGSYTCGDKGYCSECPDNNYCKAGQPRTSYSEPESSKPIEKTPTQSSSTASSTQESTPQSTVPNWVRTIFIWYAENKISESDLLKAIEFLIDNGIIKIRTG